MDSDSSQSSDVEETTGFDVDMNLYSYDTDTYGSNTGAYAYGGNFGAFDHLDGNEEIEVHSTSKTLDDDQLRTPAGSGDDEVQSEPVSDETSMLFFLGKTYSYLEEIRDEISKYSVINGYDIKFIKSEKRRLTAQCQNGCQWRLHASQMQGENTFQIKSLINSHSCSRIVENRHASAKWVATNYLDRFKSQPTWEIPFIIETVRKDFTVNITPSIAGRARTLARTLNEGKGDEQYKQVWSWAAEIYRSNPGSSVQVHTYKMGRDSLVCQRIYMCMAACKAGLLQYGRPVICLDGCHLKGSCPGQLLTAVSIDGNNGIYPVAVANVEKEYTASWTWFLQHLKQDLNLGSGDGWTIISDRQKGLLTAVQDQLPHAEQRYCLRHMYANFKTLFPGRVYKNAMFSAAKATTRYHFDIEMEKLQQLSTDAHAWLRSEHPSHWASHAFSPVPKCDMGLNNWSESFNALLLPVRDKPIITMFEMIRNCLMTRIVKKFEKLAQSTDLLCPQIRKKLEKLEGAARNWSAMCAGLTRFQVSNGYDQYVVDLNIGVCTCTRWELTGIPCVHSIPCMHFMRVAPETYVHPCYHRTTYLQMYSNFIQPMNGHQMWPHIPNRKQLIPPRRHRQPGRPKKTRVRDVDESSSSTRLKKGSKMACGICRQQGHNSRTCPHQGSTSAAASHDTFMGFNIYDGTQESSTRGRGRNRPDF